MIDWSKVETFKVPDGDVDIVEKNGVIIWKRIKLPKEYQKLEYIQFNGKQYIDTGYKGHTLNTRYETKILFTESSTQGLFGSRNAVNLSNVNNCVVFAINDNLRLDWFNGDGAKPVNVPLLVDTVYEINITRGRAVINGEEFTCSEKSSYSQLYNFVIGSFYNGTPTIFPTGFIGKLYYSKIYDKENLVREFVPCYRVFDGKPGLYDLVENKFYTNDGSDDFGFEKVTRTNLPGEYQKVEYIESTGTQWLDTGLTINTKTDIIELEFQNLENNVYKWIYGEHDTNARFGLGSGDGSDKRNVAYGPTTYKTKNNQQYDSKHVFVSNQDGVFLDDTQIANFSSFSSTSTLYLFNLNISDGGNYIGKARVWKYKHIRNGIAICELIPCYHKLTNEIGFYDCVTNTILENKGTGAFLKGEDVYENPLSDKFQLLEYIESTGTQYINTGVYLTSNHSVEIDYQLANNVQSRAGIFGILTSSRDARYGSLLSPSNQKLEHGYGSSNIYYQMDTVDTDRHFLKQKKNEIYFDGELIYTFDTASFESDKPALLCNFDYTNYTPAKSKYFSSRWWEENRLIRDFYPCFRKKDKVIGMYDVITNSFFKNVGTGTFKIDGKYMLPDEYQLLDYIESNGGPYIDTELKPDDTYGYVVDIEQISSNGEQCPIGCMDAGNRFVGVYFGHRAEGNVASGLSVGFGSYVKQETYSNGFSINERVISSCNYMNNRKIIFENNVIKDLSDTHVSGTISRNIHLFNRHYSSSAIFKGRMYRATISKGSEIIADFIPCYRKADNKPGMYDVVRNKFYTASGAGEFTYI